MRSNLVFDVGGLRRRLGLSQGELAALIPTTERTVRRWEKEGIRPSKVVILRLRELEDAKFGGITAERPATAAPKIRKRLPSPTPGTGELEAIGIAPSSY